MGLLNLILGLNIIGGLMITIKPNFNVKRQLITRPAVKIYQRHPGTELREGRRVRLAQNHLNFSIDETNNQLTQLR